MRVSATESELVSGELVRCARLAPTSCWFCRVCVCACLQLSLFPLARSIILSAECLRAEVGEKPKRDCVCAVCDTFHLCDEFHNRMIINNTPHFCCCFLFSFPSSMFLCVCAHQCFGINLHSPSPVSICAVVEAHKCPCPPSSCQVQHNLLARYVSLSKSN